MAETARILQTIIKNGQQYLLLKLIYKVDENNCIGII